MDHESFILEFAFLIADILEKEEFITQLRESDEKFLEKINTHKDIDKITISEKARTDVDVIVFGACNNYIENQIKKNKGFDIGSAIELIENHYELSKASYKERFNKNLPDVLVNIKDIAILQLNTIDIAGNRSQAQQQRNIIMSDLSKLNLDVRKIDNEINKYEKHITDIEDSIKSLKMSLKDAEDKKGEIYKDIITIISIFSAIILTMAGVFSFSSATLENLNSSNFYRLLIVVLTLGVIFSSIFISLFYFLFGVRHNKIEEFERIHRRKIIMPLIIVDVICVIVIFAIVYFKGDLLMGKYPDPVDAKESIVEPHFEGNFYNIDGDSLPSQK